MTGLQVAMMRARICPRPVDNESRKSDEITAILVRLSAVEARLVAVERKLSSLVDNSQTADAPIEPEDLPEPGEGQPKPRLTVARIKQIVCEHFGLTEVQLISHRRSQNLVWPRQLAMYFSQRLTPRSLPEIGRMLGGRDHTTVLHGRNRVAEKRASDPDVQIEIEALEARITA